MICQRCRTHLLLRLPLHQQAVRSSTPSICSPLTRNPSRFYSDISATPPPPTPRQPGGSSVTVPSPEEPAPAGTPNESVKPDAAAQPAQPSNPAAAPRIVSSCPVGTKLEGLNYFKNKPDLFAKEDHEYPDWLWTLLDDPKKKTTDTGGVDMSSTCLFFLHYGPFICDHLLTAGTPQSSTRNNASVSRRSWLRKPRRSLQRCLCINRPLISHRRRTTVPAKRRPMLCRKRPTALRSGRRSPRARERHGGRAFGNPTSCAECEKDSTIYRPERRCGLYIIFLLVVTGNLFCF